MDCLAIYSIRRITVKKINHIKWLKALFATIYRIIGEAGRLFLEQLSVPVGCVDGVQER